MNGLLRLFSLLIFAIVAEECSREKGNCCEQGLANDKLGYEHFSHAEHISCGGKIGFTATIKSPVLPQASESQYPNYCHCVWTVGSGLDGVVANLSISISHLNIESIDQKCEGDFLRITSSGGTSTIKDKICGNQLINQIKRTVTLPVSIIFNSDLDMQAFSGFTLKSKIVPDAEGNAGKTARMVDDIDEEPKSANVGAVVGILVVVIVVMASAIYILVRRNQKLRMESDGPPTLELADLHSDRPSGMYATENIYEELDVRTDLIRTESKDSIAEEKAAAQNSMRELPPIPDESEN